MTTIDPEFISFLLRAKKATYAAGGGNEAAPSRPGSHDLEYREGDWTYHDAYLGGSAFIGEEAVWKAGQPLWGMNYYGAMTVEIIPEGFSDFLKHALRCELARAPYRGPDHFEQGSFRYNCSWEGDPNKFHGEESVALDDQVIYRLRFHGGRIL